MDRKTLKRWNKWTNSNTKVLRKPKTEHQIKEVKIRLVQAPSTMTRLTILWKNNAISFPTKNKFYKSFVLSVLLYVRESFSVIADLQRRIPAFENKCCRRINHWFNSDNNGPYTRRNTHIEKKTERIKELPSTIRKLRQ